jgi:penicillin-binding protein 2
MKLSDPYNTSDLRPRAFFLAGILSFFVLLLLVRLWYLQLWKGEEYREFADKNRFKIERLAAPRGQILDRDGQILADNRPRFDVVMTRGFASSSKSKEEREAALMHQMLILKDIFLWDAATFEEKLKVVRQTPPFQDRRVARDVSWAQLAQVESRLLELTGVSVEVLAVRDYLYGDAFFHVLGYTGEVNEQDLDRLQKRFKERNYRLGDQIGVIGAEALYEKFLRGVDGRDFRVVDARGRPVQNSSLRGLGEASRENPIAGTSLRMALDLELQLTALRAFGSESGAAVAIQPQTGEILAYVSTPGLDPNWFTREITRAQLKAWRDSPQQGFLDRAVAEHYPPGSTLKLIMGAAALEEGVINEKTRYFCPGFFRFGSRIWRCHERAGHGSMDLRSAIQKSCDIFFYQTGMLLGLDRMNVWSRRFGLGRRVFPGLEIFKSQFPLPSLPRFNSEQTGNIPSVEWVEDVKVTTVEAETINAGIGQGAFLTTTLQLARMTSALGNGGKIFQPLLVLQAQKPSGEVTESFSATLENRIHLADHTRKYILDAMSAVVNEPGGTAIRSRITDFKFGGKTGTSQVVALPETRAMLAKMGKEFQHHALFVGLAPLDDPQIAVAVLVEHGQSGSKAAAPIAKAMVQSYMSRRVPVR